MKNVLDTIFKEIYLSGKKKGVHNPQIDALFGLSAFLSAFEFVSLIVVFICLYGKEINTFFDLFISTLKVSIPLILVVNATIVYYLYIYKNKYLIFFSEARSQKHYKLFYATILLFIFYAFFTIFLLLRVI